jgi:hypothetical protein
MIFFDLTKTLLRAEVAFSFDLDAVRSHRPKKVLTQKEETLREITQSFRGTSHGAVRERQALRRSVAPRPSVLRCAWAALPLSVVVGALSLIGKKDTGSNVKA